MWNDITRIDDKAENVAKFVFTKDTAVAEAVLYRYPTYAKRTVICISTQSGCPVGCRFCGAGDFFVRSLTVFFVRERMLDALPYLEHGAHWAILALGLVMLAKLYHLELPEWMTGSLGLVFIVTAVISSILEKRLNDEKDHQAHA